MKPRISDEMFETIPSMVEQGMSAQEIALQLGVRTGSLSVMCCRRGISLRRPTTGRPPRQLKSAVEITLDRSVLISLRREAERTGRRSANTLISDLLTHIVRDGLYSAVLDEKDE
jgi:hypothetical protein